jgi:hypothetical protein
MADDQQVQSLLNSLKEQIEATKAKLASLEKAYFALAPESREARFRDVRLWIAIRDYLKEVGKSSVHDLVDALKAGGADLGKYPLRSVKLSVVSKHMQDIFEVKKVGNDDVVSLRENRGGPSKPRRVK